MTTTHDTHELSGRQRFELAMLGDELSNPERVYADALSDIVRYVEAEGITPAMFTQREKLSLKGGYLAAILVEQPESFHTSEAVGRALLLAGFNPSTGVRADTPTRN